VEIFEMYQEYSQQVVLNSRSGRDNDTGNKHQTAEDDDYVAYHDYADSRND